MDRRERDVRLLAKEYGGVVSLSGKNHWRVTLPNGRVVMAPGTSGDARNLRNLRAQLRRAADAGA